MNNFLGNYAVFIQSFDKYYFDKRSLKIFPAIQMDQLLTYWYFSIILAQISRSRLFGDNIPANFSL